MASIAARFPEKLVTEFETRLGAKVESEKITGTSRYSFLVISDRFKKMRAAKRRDVVWKIVDESLTSDESFKIGIILPVDPSEVKER